MEEKSNLLSEQVAKSANNLEGKSGVAKRTCSVIKQVRVCEIAYFDISGLEKPNTDIVRCLEIRNLIMKMNLLVWCAQI